MQQILRIFLYIAAVLAPLFIAAALNPSDDAGILYQTGRSFALVGTMILIMQVLLAARIKWIEKAFGFDIIIRYHKLVALFGLVLIILHPLLLVAPHGRWSLLVRLDVPWYIWMGKIALMLLLINIVLSIFQQRIGMSFENWRLSHDIISPLIIAFVFAHSIVAGFDLANPVLQSMWILIFSAAVVLFVYHRLVRPALLARNPYHVKEVVQEADGVWTVQMVPPGGKPHFDFTPGQFQFITFKRGRDFPEEEHHWTISSSPQDEYVASTIKSLGDFSSTIGQTEPGDEAVIHAPFGRFSYLYHQKETELVFIAGGIGITPFISMLRHMQNTGTEIPVVLLYGNPTEEAIVFRDELKSIESTGLKKLRVVHVIEKPGESWTGERGFIDENIIRKYTGEVSDTKGYYVVGPAAMSENVIRSLHSIGVKDRQIHQEIFSFL